MQNMWNGCRIHVKLTQNGNVVNNVNVVMNQKNVVECITKDSYDTSGFSLTSRLLVNKVEVQERACCVLFWHWWGPEHKTWRR